MQKLTAHRSFQQVLVLVPILALLLLITSILAPSTNAQESPITPPITPPTTPTPTPTTSPSPSPTPDMDDPVVTTSRLHTGRLGLPYFALVRATQPGGNESLMISANNLPEGLEINRCRVLPFLRNSRTHCFVQGVPEESGVFDVEIVATNSDGKTDSEMTTLVIRDYHRWFWFNR